MVFLWLNKRACQFSWSVLPIRLYQFCASRYNSCWHNIPEKNLQQLSHGIPVAIPRQSTASPSQSSFWRFHVMVNQALCDILCPCVCRQIIMNFRLWTNHYYQPLFQSEVIMIVIINDDPIIHQYCSPIISDPNPHWWVLRSMRGQAPIVWVSLKRDLAAQSRRQELKVVACYFPRPMTFQRHGI